MSRVYSVGSDLVERMKAFDQLGLEPFRNIDLQRIACAERRQISGISNVDRVSSVESDRGEEIAKLKRIALQMVIGQSDPGDRLPVGQSNDEPM